MKLGMSIHVLCTACLVLLSSVSCEQAQSKRVANVKAHEEVNARLREEYQGAVLQIGPAQEPVGGSAVMIIPTDEFVLKRNKKIIELNPGLGDYIVQQSKDRFLAMAEALRRRSLFDEVKLVQSDDQDLSFDDDFAVIPSPTKLEWIVKQRGPGRQRIIPLQVEDFSKSFSVRLRFWLDGVEQATRDLKREGEK